jgi:hypothetical protein
MNAMQAAFMRAGYVVPTPIDYAPAITYNWSWLIPKNIPLTFFKSEQALIKKHGAGAVYRLLKFGDSPTKSMNIHSQFKAQVEAAQQQLKSGVNYVCKGSNETT